jgi:hypothetical protein
MEQTQRRARQGRQNTGQTRSGKTEENILTEKIRLHAAPSDSTAGVPNPGGSIRDRLALAPVIVLRYVSDAMRNTNILPILISLAASIPLAHAETAAPAPAKPPATSPQPPDGLFKALDRDADGRLSVGEFAVGQVSDAARRVFAGMDRDADGYLSAGEYRINGSAPPAKAGAR